VVIVVWEFTGYNVITSVGDGECNLGAAAAVVLGLVIFTISAGSVAFFRRRREVM